VVRKVRCVKFLSNSSEETDEKVQSSRSAKTQAKDLDVMEDDGVHEIQREADEERFKGRRTEDVQLENDLNQSGSVTTWRRWLIHQMI
jgi:hypothetical protein